MSAIVHRGLTHIAATTKAATATTTIVRMPFNTVGIPAIAENMVAMILSASMCDSPTARINAWWVLDNTTEPKSQARLSPPISGPTGRKTRG